VTGNTSTHNGNGIFLDAGANQNLIQGNFCLNNSNGIWVEDQAGFNRIAANVALRSAVFDLNDFNRSCDHNVWAANRVLPGVTANQPCIH
jgi:parallel beta-helix repeat protein